MHDGPSCKPGRAESYCTEGWKLLPKKADENGPLVPKVTDTGREDVSEIACLVWCSARARKTQLACAWASPTPAPRLICARLQRPVRHVREVRVTGLRSTYLCPPRRLPRHRRFASGIPRPHH